MSSSILVLPFKLQFSISISPESWILTSKYQMTPSVLSALELPVKRFWTHSWGELYVVESVLNFWMCKWNIGEICHASILLWIYEMNIFKFLWFFSTKYCKYCIMQRMPLRKYLVMQYHRVVYFLWLTFIPLFVILF